MKIFKTLLGYNSLTSIEKTLDTLGENDVHVFLDMHVETNQIAANLINNPYVASVNKLPKHMGIHLAPLYIYTQLPITYSHLLHLDDDLILGKNYYDAMLQSMHQLSVEEGIDIISSDIHNDGIFSDHNLYQKQTPQWSNALMSRRYICTLLNSPWFDLYYNNLNSKVGRENIIGLCNDILEKQKALGNENIYNRYKEMPELHYCAQDVFQNLFILSHKIRTALIIKPRATLQKLDRTNTNVDFVERYICKTSDLCHTYDEDNRWLCAGISHQSNYWPTLKQEERINHAK